MLPRAPTIERVAVSKLLAYNDSEEQTLLFRHST